jgi:hypothetical protein
VAAVSAPAAAAAAAAAAIALAGDLDFVVLRLIGFATGE